MSIKDGIDDKNPDDGIDGDKGKGTVSYESHQKLLDQRKADQKKMADIETELATFKAKEKELADKENELREKKLKEDGNWQTLLESREKRAKELEEENSALQESVKGFEKKFTDAHKLNAFKEAIGGSLKHEKYFDFIDTNKIALDPKTGVIDDKSLKAYAAEFVNEHKDLIQFKSSAKLPGGAAQPAGVISYEQWLELAKTNPKEAKARQKDVK